MLVDYHVSENGKAVYQFCTLDVASETDRHLAIVSCLEVFALGPVRHLLNVKHCEVVVEEVVPRPVILKHFRLDASVSHHVNVNDYDAVEDVCLFVSVASAVLHPSVLVHLGRCPCPDLEQEYLQVVARS